MKKIEPAVRQVWQSRDKRDCGKVVVINSIVGFTAFCRIGYPRTDTDGQPDGHFVWSPRNTKMHVSKMPKSYKLVRA